MHVESFICAGAEPVAETDITAPTRLLLLTGEFLLLQLLIQDRCRYLWSALDQKRCGLCLTFVIWTEVVCTAVFIGLAIKVLERYLADEANISWFLFSLVFVWMILAGFCGWVVFMTHMLARVAHRLGRVSTIARRGGAAVETVKHLRACKITCFLNWAGMVISLTTTIGLLGVWIVWSFQGHSNHLRTVMIAQWVNLLCNIVGVVLLSGAYRLGIRRAPAIRTRTSRRAPCARKQGAGPAASPPKGMAWQAKTEELAGRGISLEQLLQFYSALGGALMPTYQPGMHTTNDVVRLAIIPLTASTQSSYANMVNGVLPVRPKKMAIG